MRNHFPAQLFKPCTLFMAALIAVIAFSWTR